MAETKPIPIRLTEEMINRLDRAAVKAHMSNRTEVMKVCITSFLEYFETHGEATLPLDWAEILKDMDGRTQRYPEKVVELKVAEEKPGYVTKPEMSLEEEKRIRDAKRKKTR